METIKIFSRTGYVIGHNVILGILDNNCDFAQFNSESDIDGIDRENIVRNFTAASEYRDNKNYSILMDDDIALGSGAIEALLSGLDGYDVATLPVNDRHSKIQHAIMVIKNDILDKHNIKIFNLHFCNQCVFVGHLIDRYGVKVNALEGPMQYTVERKILRKGSKNE